MMRTALFIDGIGFWTRGLGDWPAGSRAFRGDGATDTAAVRPAAALLAANERRRAPDSVLVALEVASQALAGSGHDARRVATVFASAHGDLGITDALCRTLADQPLQLSPTRFHHSVHNAASGYWAIASGSHAASTALAAHEHSFAAGLMEAACQCAADTQPVLLVACDTEAQGALRSVNRSRGLLGLALLLSPVRSAASLWAVDFGAVPAADVGAARSDAARRLADNATAPGLPLFEALAHGRATRLSLACGATSVLSLGLT